MTEITFNELPRVVSQLAEKLNHIERLLLSQNESKQTASDKFLNIKEAADFIGLSVPTVYGLVHRLDIPHMKRNKRLYFSKQALTEWITSGHRKTKQEIESAALNSLAEQRKK